MLWQLRKLGRVGSIRRLAYFLYRAVYLGRTVSIKNGPLKGMKWTYKDGQQFWLPLGRYEPETADWLARNIKPGALFFDVGANWGYFTLAGSRMAGEDGTVLSFEPLPKNQEFILEQIEANGLKNVQIKRCAVSDRVGTATFSLEAQNSNSHLSAIDIPHAKSAKVEEFEVDTVTLDHIVEEIGRSPDVIKLDVEGAENLVAYGATKLIGDAKTRWIISTHSDELKSELSSIFERAGYSVAELQGFEHEILCTPKAR